MSIMMMMFLSLSLSSHAAVPQRLKMPPRAFVSFFCGLLFVVACRVTLASAEKPFCRCVTR
jgi:hypothetical protein